MEKNIKKPVRIPFEEALDKTGFGIYSYINTFLSGLAIISMACVVYGSTLTVPASTCELQTTGGQRGLLVAAPVVGLILGAPLWGYLGDTRGRRNMLLVALVASALINAVSSLSVNWIMLMILQFVASLLASADYSLAMTLLSECVPMGKRNMAVMWVNCITMLAQGVMAVLAMPIAPLTYSYHIPGLNIYWNSWRTIVLMYSLPSVVCACCFYFMQDSPKLTLVKGDEQRAIEILKTIHRVNFGKNAVLDVQGLLPETLLRDSGLSKKEQIIPLFKAPLLKHTIIVSLLFMFQLSGSFMAWLPTIANLVIRMYETGQVTNMNLCSIINSDIDMSEDYKQRLQKLPARLAQDFARHISQNKVRGETPDATPCAMNMLSLLVVLGVGALQASLNAFITLFVVNRAGRRITSMAVTAVLGLCGVLVSAVAHTAASAALFAAFLLGYIVMGLYTAMAVALFPTHLRAMAIALTTTAGNVTTFICIQLVNLLVYSNCELGFYLFASVYASSAIVAAFLPDDRFLHKPLPQARKPSAYIERL